MDGKAFFQKQVSMIFIEVIIIQSTIWIDG